MQTIYVVALGNPLHKQTYMFPTRWMHIALSYQFTLPYTHLNIDNSSTDCPACTG